MTILYSLFSGDKTSETVALLGGIHGNETSGTYALQRLTQELQSGKIQLTSGKLIIVPICNPLAHEKGVRYVEKNLNRCFFHDSYISSGTLEESYASEIKKILQDHEVTRVMDLHSTSGPSIPFMFCEKKNLTFGRQLGISHIITGWSKLGNGVLSGDTENYVNLIPGGMGFTFEAGDHNNPEGQKNAYQMALNFLVAHGMISENYFQMIGGEEIIIDMDYVYILEGDSFEYSIESIENFSDVYDDGLIGYSIQRNGEKTAIYAPKESTLIMPKAFDIHKNEEVFFIGKRLYL